MMMIMMMMMTLTTEEPIRRRGKGEEKTIRDDEIDLIRRVK